MRTKYNCLDLFAGCGGLLDGFMQTGFYSPKLSVEWEIAPIKTLRKRLSEKWGICDVEETVIHFDIQRTEELFKGFDNDATYGSFYGINKLLNGENIDIVIGGPPCQSYSVAGRIRDSEKMQYDYRNYLFEHYLEIVDRLKPKIFIFENVPGMLSAMPDGTPIMSLINRDIQEIGYEIIDNVKKFAVLDTSDYGVPQQRRRVILLGINKEFFRLHNKQGILLDFYQNILAKRKLSTKSTVYDAISDLPPCYPFYRDAKPSHSVPETDLTWHYSRYHSLRDVRIFEMLANDIKNGQNKFTDSNILKKLYNEATGSNTQVHKYHVLKPGVPSTTILAHLYKDGLRFIHYDPEQARTITVREAARLQSFDDDFDFVGSQGDAYKMIGNAVPPKFSRMIAESVYEFLTKYGG